MKKFLFVALAVVPMLATAQAGYYVQGDVGYSRLKMKHEAGGDNTVSYGVAVGKKVEGNARVAVDYKYLGKDKETVRLSDTTTATAKAEGHSVGLSAIYDFTNDSPVTPYLGMRVSVNHLKGETEIAGVKNSEHETRLGLGAVAGVAYQVAPNLAVDGGIEYNYVGNYAGGRAYQHGAKAGVRYDF